MRALHETAKRVFNPLKPTTQHGGITVCGALLSHLSQFVDACGNPIHAVEQFLFLSFFGYIVVSKDDGVVAGDKGDVSIAHLGSMQ